ncbi:DUF982 domain-containing protein [Rhizobium sp. P38BS-XIX]|nr:DUF982 domain-containing protein [Rhizobium sp. P38BS-XIX]
MLTPFVGRQMERQTTQWSDRPITVQAPMGIGWIVGPTLAMDYLLSHWPPNRDDDALQAAIIDALDGRSMPEEARKALVDALRKAGITYCD